MRTIRRKGYQVAPLTLKSVADLFSFWLIIGPEVVQQGIVAASDEQLERVIKDLNDLDVAHSTESDAVDVLGFVTVANDLLGTLAEASDNHYLNATYQKISGEVIRVWTLISDSELATPKKHMSVDEWSDVIRRRDGEALAEQTRSYIQAVGDLVTRTLLRWPSVATSEVVPLHRT